LSFQISPKCGLCGSLGWQKNKHTDTDQADLWASQEKKKEVGYLRGIHKPTAAKDQWANQIN